MARQLAIALGFSVLASAAFAQPPAPGPGGPATRITGVVTAVTPASITIKAADGKETVLALALTVTVIKTHPVDIEAIKPGVFVATANTNIDDASGKSIELRMFEPGSHAGEGSRPMSAPNTTMTNGTVETVKKGDNGRELDVSFPGGTRHIIVPPDVQVIGSFPADRSDLMSGETVTASAGKAPDGSPIATRISIAGKS